MFCLDANSLITPWYVLYKPEVFLSLWEKLADHKDKLIIIEPIFKEIEPISPYDKENLSDEDLRQKYSLQKWLTEHQFYTTLRSISAEDNQTSLTLEQRYEINNKSRGASQNDIKLIAFAKRTGDTVVTLETLQTQSPKEKRNWKIPIICEKESVGCINFIQLLERLNIKI